MKKKLLNIINSYKVIIIVLILLCVFLLIYLNKITSANKIYLFEGSSDYVEVKSGVVSLNYNINLFQGSNIEFKEKDKTVVSYDIGYYVLVNDEYLPLATKAGEDDEGLSLKELITGTDNYKIIEPANGNYFFTKDKINNLDSNLFFIIKATDNKNNEIKDAIKNVSYECEAGYVLDKTDNKCKKEVTTTTSIAARENPVSYNCNNYPGYTLEGDKCVKTISTNFTDKKEVTINYDYKCSKGELTSDKTKCSYTEKVPATINATCNKYQSCTTSREFNASTGKFEDKRTCVTKCNYSCPGGFDYNKSKRTCTGEITETKTIVSEKFISSYSCPTGYEKNGNYCTKTTTNITTDKKEATKNPTTYYCENSGHTLNGALCKYEVKNVLVKEAKVIESYSCEKDYTLNKTKCEKIVSTTDTKDVISETVCPSGYNLNNDKCTKNIIKYRYSERSCVGGSIDYKWSDSENDEALLKQGYVLTGVKEQRNSK